jgi:hypothetical protein
MLLPLVSVFSPIHGVESSPDSRRILFLTVNSTNPGKLFSSARSRRGKACNERGFYMHPELYGRPQEKQLQWARNPERMRSLKAKREAAEAARHKALGAEATNQPLSGHPAQLSISPSGGR